MSPTRVVHDEVAVMLDLLFDLPADVQPDIDETLAELDPVEARRCLVARLRSAYRRGDSSVYQALFDRLGLGEERGTLEAIVGDSDACPGSRATAIEILAGDDAEAHARLIESIPEAERGVLADEPLRELIADAIEDAIAAEAIAVVADHFPPDGAEPLEEHLERLRRAMGAPATTIYEHLLRSSRLEPLRGPMIDAIVEEAAPAGLALLQSLESDTSWNPATDGLESAIRTIRERLEAGTAACEHAEGRLGPIDATGRFEAGIVCTNPDGTRTLAMLLVKGNEVVDGFADFDPADDFLRSAHVPRVEVSAQAVADLVAPAMRSTEASKLDSMTLAAVRLFERIGAPCALPSAEPAESISAEEVAALMSREEYCRWTFAADDLHAAGIPEPPAEPDDAWLAGAIRKLDSASMRERVSRAADLMSRWHLAAGDEREASLLARIGLDVKERFPEMFCVREMMRRSVAKLHAPDPEDDGEDVVDPDDLIDRDWDPARARHEIVLGVVERQIEEGSPACVRETFEALRGRGVSEADAKRSIAEVLRHEICEMLADGHPRNNGHYRAALETLL